MDEEKQKKVYNLLTRIPRGKVVTYKQISDFLELNSARLVGSILHQNPSPDKFPCHRVVFRDGKLSEKYAFGGLKKQKRKLEQEGVTFVGEKVDMKRSLYNFVGGSTFSLLD